MLCALPGLYNSDAIIYALGVVIGDQLMHRAWSPNTTPKAYITASELCKALMPTHLCICVYM